MKVSDLFSQKMLTKIETIKYNAIELDKKILNKNLTLEVSDRIEFDGRNENQIKYMIFRDVYFSPDCLFQIQIVGSVTRYLKDDIEIDVESFDFDSLLDKLNNEETTNLMGGIYADLSIIISQLTLVANRSPLVLEPVCHGERRKSERRKNETN